MSQTANRSPAASSGAGGPAGGGASSAVGGPSGPSGPSAAPVAGGFLARLAPNVIGFVSSAAVMVLELVAGRLVADNVGSSQYTWTSIIGVILAGMSIGNWVGGWLADRYRPVRIVWVLFLVSAGLILLTLPLNWYAVPPIKSALIPNVIQNPGGNSHLWGLSILLMMTVVFLAPATALGVISPVLAKMAIEANRSSGRAVGNFYSWGAVGAIVGTFIPAFILVPAMGVRAIMLLVAAVMAALGGLCYIPVYLENRRLAAEAAAAAGGSAFPGGKEASR
jgi:MFS family permease